MFYLIWFHMIFNSLFVTTTTGAPDVQCGHQRHGVYVAKHQDKDFLQGNTPKPQMLPTASTLQGIINFVCTQNCSASVKLR